MAKINPDADKFLGRLYNPNTATWTYFDNPNNVYTEEDRQEVLLRLEQRNRQGVQWVICTK